MGLISKIASTAATKGVQAFKGAKKVVGLTPKPANKVLIMSDEITKIPGTLNLTTGTKTFKDIGGGIRVVMPGESTKLGKLGVESITTFPKDYFIKSSVLHAVKFKGAKKPMPVMTAEELKQFWPLMQTLKDAANPLNKAANAVKNMLG